MLGSAVMRRVITVRHPSDAATAGPVRFRSLKWNRKSLAYSPKVCVFTWMADCAQKLEATRSLANSYMYIAWVFLSSHRIIVLSLFLESLSHLCMCVL